MHASMHHKQRQVTGGGGGGRGGGDQTTRDGKKEREFERGEGKGQENIVNKMKNNVRVHEEPIDLSMNNLAQNLDEPLLSDSSSSSTASMTAEKPWSCCPCM